MAAVGSERVSKVVGYIIGKLNQNVTTNLPMRIAVLGEANTANQTDLSLDPKEITSTKQVGDLYGYGCPIYHLARILKPISGDGVGGIPIVIYPQAAAVGSTARVMTITPVGVATANATHTLKISGRTGLDGTFYSYQVATGDTVDDITVKISDAINNVLGAPVIATSTDYETTLTTKWTGLTAQGLNVEIDTAGIDAGITYAYDEVTAGSGTPSVQAALDLFGNEWNTIVINSYGAVTSVMDTLESFNGIPDPTNPTGRYAGITMKPFFALTGSVLDNPSTITDSRKNNVTIVICPAPLSSGFQFEAAANVCVSFARISQDAPNLDACGSFYSDMPTPTNIGLMEVYDNRDQFVKKGCSTVELVSGRYRICDLVTTYHPDGEVVPQFRFCRSLIIDFNYKFRYYILQEANVLGHSIANDNDVVTAQNVVKPKMWKAVLAGLADEMTSLGMISDPAFTKANTTVQISTTNPDRFDNVIAYKRTGYARISATEAQAGFNFGSNS